MIFAVALLQNTVPEGRMFALDQQTIISVVATLLNFCILAVVMGLLLYKPVQKYMRKRTERISGQLEDARAKVARAEALQAEYEAKLQGIAAERAAALESAREEAAERGRHLLEEARAEAAALKQRAEEGIALEKERLKKETWQHIVEISALMTEKLVGKAVDSSAQARLFEDALTQLEDTPWPS